VKIFLRHAGTVRLLTQTSVITSMFGRRRSSDNGSNWKKEKERKLNLSREDRRKEYSCGDAFVPLSDIATWRTDFTYQTKVNKNKHVVSNQEKSAMLDGFKPENVELNDKVSFFVGDITKLEIDCIVNAANRSLLGGGGVDGAIHRAAGGNLFEENKTSGGCEDGEAKISGGYNLPAKFVVSTVGPRGHGREVLQSSYRNCLDLMRKNGLRTIAFPCISTGVYGYPNDDACAVALKTVRTFIQEHPEDVDRVIFCLFLQVDVELYEKYLPIFFPAVQEIQDYSKKTLENQEQEADSKKNPLEELEDASTDEEQDQETDSKETSDKQEHEVDSKETIEQPMEIEETIPKKARKEDEEDKSKD